MDSPILWIGLTFVFGVWFYTRLGMRVHQTGGAVHGGGLGLPDLTASIIIGTTLAVLSVLTFLLSFSSQVEQSADQVVPSMIFQLALTACIVAFLLVRRVPLGGVLNPSKISAPRAIGWGVLMLLVALPVVGAFSLIAQFLPQDLRQEQQLVTLFGDVSKEGNLETILLISLTAVVVAPICEEFLFRGYFYPVLKRYIGVVGAMFMTAGLFALMHANLAAFPGLFALAICLTLAFEASGNILVPMAMHALFNASSLLMLYLRAQGLV